MTSRKVHWQLLVCSIKIVPVVSTDFSSIIDTARIRNTAYDMTCLSVWVSHHATTAPTGGGFAAA